MALQSTRLPTLKSLYNDEEVLEKVPVADMSLEMAEQFNASLNCDVPVEQALAELQTELQNIVNQG